MTRAEAIDATRGSADEREVSLEVKGGHIVGWMSGSGPAMVLLHGGRALSDYLRELAGELSSAFTVFHGALDPIPAHETERSAALVPGAQVHVLEGIGHFPWLEEPGTVVGLLREFAAQSGHG
jgi:hypothetical protein